jgi:hypothetical protein
MTMKAMSAYEPRGTRYVFHRRGLLINGGRTIQIRTRDVSLQGLGVISPEPVTVGASCSINLNAVVGAQIVQLDFSCTVAYCILAGIHGFRIGLHIDDSLGLHRPQLQKIIDMCLMSAI